MRQNFDSTQVNCSETNRKLPPPQALRFQSQASARRARSTRNLGRARFALPFLPCAAITSQRERDVWERGRTASKLGTHVMVRVVTKYGK